MASKGAGRERRSRRRYSGAEHEAAVADVAVICAINAYSVGGTVSGLAGSGLVLRNNAGEDLGVASNGAFTFVTSVLSGGSYSVSVRTQPSSPSQTCVVANATGTVGGSAITDVAVTCTTNSYSVGGTVSGLAGSGLVLQNNAGDDLAVTGNGAFTFTTSILSEGSYSVSVKAQPTSPTQTCAVTNGTGTVGGSAITNVAVTCTTNTYSVGGTVSGLLGTGLVLQNNLGDDLPITSNGAFTFATRLTSGSGYSVTVKTQPTAPIQACTVTNATGTGTAVPVTSVQVTCPSPRFVDNLDGTVTDNETGRMWMQDVAPEGACGASGCTQPGAIAYCNNLVLAGHSDWRLPNIADMQSFIQGCPDSETGGACLADDTTCASTSCQCAGCGGPGPGVNGYFMDPVFMLTTWPPSGVDGFTGNAGYLATNTSGSPSLPLAWAIYYYSGNLNGSNGNWKSYSARCVRP